MALGVYSENTSRLNIYIYPPDGIPKAFVAEAWGGGLLTHRACIVAKDRATQQIKIIGEIVPKHVMAENRDKKYTRVKIVEEGLSFGDRHEFMFHVQDVDVDSQAIVRQRPFMDPHALLRHHAKQEF
jgi:hypothetical protein